MARPRLTPQANVWSPEALLVPSARYLALFVIAASFVFPFKGFGIDLCWLHSTTGLPCPGCGMTRAFVALTSGDFATAVGMNPFVLLAYPTFIVLAGCALSPFIAERVERWVSAHAKAVGWTYRLSLIAFLVFGAGRLALMLVLGERFP